MSEIQRYEFSNGNVGCADRIASESGRYVTYTDLLRYKRDYFVSLAVNILAILVCAVLSALLVHEKSSHRPVTVPMGAGEKAILLMGMQNMQADKEKAETQRDDYKAMALNYKAQIKALNAREDGRVAQLVALQARGQELDRINKEQAQRMSTHQGVVLEAKRVLGVNVQVVE
jgi:hypothetical protein